MSVEPHEYTSEEMTVILLKQIWLLVDYWENVERDDDKAGMSRLEGLAFSILSMLDGCGTAMPAMCLVPEPHEADQAYAEEHGEDWWPNDGLEAMLGVPRISDMLHERFWTFKPDK